MKADYVNKPFFNTNPYPIPRRPDPTRPSTNGSSIAVGMEFDFQNGNTPSIDFHKGQTFTLTTSNTIEQVALSMLQNPDPLHNINARRHRLTIHNQYDKRYILIRLGDKHSNLQFAATIHPVQADNQSPYKALFSDLVVLDRQGNPVAAGQEGGVLAYFLFDGSQIPNTTPEYIAQFNLYLELIDRDNKGAIERRIPIIIDPDTRYPRGTNP